jgi:hypothetical protein
MKPATEHTRWMNHILTLQLAHTLALLVDLYASEALSERSRVLVYREVEALDDGKDAA